MLERRWPQEYARTERIEQISEQPDEKKSSCTILYNNQGNLAELLSFPIHPSMKQVEGKTPDTVADQALPEIPPHWKGTGN